MMELYFLRIKLGFNPTGEERVLDQLHGHTQNAYSTRENTFITRVLVALNQQPGSGF